MVFYFNASVRDQRRNTKARCESVFQVSPGFGTIYLKRKKTIRTRGVFSFFLTHTIESQRRTDTTRHNPCNRFFWLEEFENSALMLEYFNAMNSGSHSWPASYYFISYWIFLHATRHPGKQDRIHWCKTHVEKATNKTRLGIICFNLWAVGFTKTLSSQIVFFNVVF